MEKIDTRKLILEKARELFLEKGYTKASMRSIANSIGISTWPLYTHFKDKDEIYIAICIEGYEILILQLEKILKTDVSAPEKLREAFYVYQNFYYQNSKYSRLIRLALNPATGIELTPQIKAQLFSKENQTYAIMEKIVIEGINQKQIRGLDPKSFVLFLCSLANGIFQLKDSGILDENSANENMIEKMIDYVGYIMIPNLE